VNTCLTVLDDFCYGSARLGLSLFGGIDREGGGPELVVVVSPKVREADLALRQLIEISQSNGMWRLSCKLFCRFIRIVFRKSVFLMFSGI